jgi:hypothetical protein
LTLRGRGAGFNKKIQQFFPGQLAMDKLTYGRVVAQFEL